MRNTHFRTRNMAWKTEKKCKIQKCPLQDMEYGKKTEIMENEKHPLDDLKNDETTKKL